MSDKLNRIIEIVKKIDSLHINDPRFSDLTNEITEILCEDKSQTFEVINSTNDPNVFYYISISFGYIYNKYPDLALFSAFEKSTENLKIIVESSGYQYFEHIRREVEEARSHLAWYDEDKRRTIYYDNLMTTFNNSSEDERFNLIINTSKEEDITYYLNLSFDDNNDCIYPEFDFSTSGQAFSTLIHKYSETSFASDAWYLGRIATLFDKVNYQTQELFKKEAEKAILNGTEHDIINLLKSVNKSDFNKAIIIIRSIKDILTQTKSQKVKTAVQLFINRFKDSFLKYFLEKTSYSQFY